MDHWNAGWDYVCKRFFVCLGGPRARWVCSVQLVAIANDLCLDRTLAGTAADARDHQRPVRAGGVRLPTGRPGGPVPEPPATVAGSQALAGDPGAGTGCVPAGACSGHHRTSSGTPCSRRGEFTRVAVCIGRGRGLLVALAPERSISRREPERSAISSRVADPREADGVDSAGPHRPVECDGGKGNPLSAAERADATDAGHAGVHADHCAAGADERDATFPADLANPGHGLPDGRRICVVDSHQSGLQLAGRRRGRNHVLLRLSRVVPTGHAGKKPDPRPGVGDRGGDCLGRSGILLRPACTQRSAGDVSWVVVWSAGKFCGWQSAFALFAKAD